MKAADTAAYYADHPRARTTALAIIAIGSLLNPLMLSSVNVAVPDIGHELQADAVMLSWIPTAFMLASAACLLPFGKLADMYGRKLIYLGGMVLLTVGALAAAVAPTMEVLLAARVVQGVSSAMVFGTGTAILAGIFPARRLGSALGIYASAVYIGLTGGPWYGGLVTEALGWRMVFMLQVPVSLLVVVVTALVLRGEWKMEPRPRFDWQGALIFGAWASALVIGLSWLPSWRGAALSAGSVLLLTWFVRDQIGKEHPLVRLRALRANHVFSYSMLAAFFMYGANFPIVFLLSLYLQYIGGLNPGQAGALLIVQALMMAVMAPLAGRLADRFEARVLTTVGCIVVAGGFLWLTQLGHGSAQWVVVVGQLLVGTGFGFFSTPNTTAAMSAVKSGNLGVASALVNLARTIGNLIGMGIVMLIFALTIGRTQILPEEYDSLLFTVRCALALSAVYAMVGAYFCWSRGRTRQ
ncbi:MAG: MFS transporter [Gammaproteobacteria bacterium]|nr:MFS transporter [Gammaproteobacteria bacterium]